MNAGAPAGADRAAQAWAALATVMDPEVPVVSLVELGIAREARLAEDGAVEVLLTPTYSGCPATEVIREAVVQALKQAGAREVKVTTTLDPPWTTDWISPEAAEKLRAYGIAPPHLSAGQAQTLHFHPKNIACPRCGSLNTQRLSAFGATACKALHRCLDCLEPFEHFKPI